ncbi:hypothetical protein ACNO8X_11970 [Mycobacterium sp. PDNC021]|uniref:hypothetical protein n=1 Tax=Mycobacterium sp. PDNC021 TaxID=3391399 RepID=UPI003AAEDC85
MREARIAVDVGGGVGGGAYRVGESRDGRRTPRGSTVMVGHIDSLGMATKNLDSSST